MNKVVKIVLLLLTLSSCTENPEPTQTRQFISPGDTVSHEQVKTLTALSDTVLTLFRKVDLIELSQYVHPVSGVVFSPTGYLDTNTAVVFSKQQVKKLWTGNTNFIWGFHDGSGEPIKMNFREYYSKFIYDQDFLNAEKKAKNKIIGKGNTIVNILEVFPGAEFVEYHFSGFDPKYEGMDWKSLRLVFEEYNGKLYLVAVVHDQWSI